MMILEQQSSQFTMVAHGACLHFLYNDTASTGVQIPQKSMTKLQSFKPQTVGIRHLSRRNKNEKYLQTLKMEENSPVFG